MLRGPSFSTPRALALRQSLSGESCPDRHARSARSTSTTSPRTAAKSAASALFNLTPPPGVAAQLGFAPFGSPVVLDVATARGRGRRLHDGAPGPKHPSGPRPQRALSSRSGALPGARSHDGERGNCLNEAEPNFPWAKCSVGARRPDPPQAYLSLPTRCSRARCPSSARRPPGSSPGKLGASRLNRDSGGGPARARLLRRAPFEPTSRAGPAHRPEGLLAARLQLPPPQQRRRAHRRQPARPRRRPRRRSSTCRRGHRQPLGRRRPRHLHARPSTPPRPPLSEPGARLPERLEDRRLLGPHAALRSERIFEGSIYLATPDDPDRDARAPRTPSTRWSPSTWSPRLPERGVQVKLAGRIDPDPATGDLIATFDGLPQLPYTDLELNFRTGQRAFLITPPACGPAMTQIE